MSDSRLEKFIYAICLMDVSDLPVPLSRIEKLWNCLITGETPDFEPLSRNEKYLMAMLDRYDISNLPAPMSRGEKLLYKIAMGETDLSDVPGYLSRYEELLKYLIENGGISEGDFEYVLYTLNQSMYTLYTTAEKPVKSAILTGQTLIDLKDSFENGTYSGGVNKYESNVRIRSVNKFTEIGTFTFSVNSGYQLFIQGYNSERNEHWGSEWDSTKTLVTTSGDIFGIVIKRSDEAEMSVDEFERIGFTTNLFISGDLVSVKMPVLTTSNLGNLVSVNDFEQGGFFNNSGVENTLDFCRSGFIDVEFPQYTLSHSGSGCWTQIFEFDENKKYIKYSNKNSNKYTATLENNTKYIRVCVSKTFANIDSYDISLCPYESTNKEPYKTNILSTSEDVELRGVGEVRDELNLLTGEVTERIGKIILDGTQSSVTYNSEYSNDDYYCFMYDITKNGYKKAPSSPIGISCPIPFQQNKMFPWTTAKEFVLIDSNNLVVKLLKSKLNNDNSISSLNTYLASNPITINYPLKTESVKTVDLTVVNQDNQPTKLGTFENVTHVSLEAENLIPEVEMEVATRISEELASASPLMDDISTEQQQLNKTIDEQSENVDATMIATTEIFEETL